MFHLKLRQAVATIVAAFAVLGLAAPVAEARKPVRPIEPIAPVPCICLPPVDVT